MPLKRKTKTQIDPNHLNERFTPGQLVRFISISIFFLLMAFFFGVLVGKKGRFPEQAASNASQAAQPAPVDVQKSALAKEKENKKASGDIVSPNIDLAKRYNRPSPAPLKSNPPKNTPPQTPKRVVSVQLPPPAPAEKKPAAPVTEDKPTPAATPEPPSPAENKPVEKPEQPKVEVVKTDPAPAPEKKEATPPAPVNTAPAAVTTPPPVSASTTSKGNYGIQLAAFSGKTRKKDALDYQRRLKSNAGLDAVIIPSEDDKWHKVLLVGYKDRAEANKACMELKKKAGFAEVWVTALQ